MEGNETFPLLEPEPIKEAYRRESHDTLKSVARFPLKEQKSSMKKASTFPPLRGSEDDGEHIEMDSYNLYQSNCSTCQKNWDLLNRNERHNKTELAHPNEDIGTKPKGRTTPWLSDPIPKCLSFDLDGLLPSTDRQQVRLRQILASKEVSQSWLNVKQ